MSSRTIAGRRVAIASTAAAPSAASPTTSNPPAWSNARADAWKAAWSSTMSTLHTRADRFTRLSVPTLWPATTADATRPGPLSMLPSVPPRLSRHHTRALGSRSLSSRFCAAPHGGMPGLIHRRQRRVRAPASASRASLRWWVRSDLGRAPRATASKTAGHVPVAPTSTQLSTNNSPLVPWNHPTRTAPGRVRAPALEAKAGCP